MNFHSLAFRHEMPHLSMPRPSNDHRILAALLPFVLGITMALMPPPPELAQCSWWSLSLFVTVIVGLIMEPVPVAAVGYEETRLGKRISLSRLGGRSFALGYAIMPADPLPAPFTPSNTARSGGTIFSVIKNIPEFHQSLPNDPASRRIGSYLMWTARRCSAGLPCGRRTSSAFLL